MIRLSILAPDSFVSMPWKNGLGHTVELLRDEGTDADRFDWRISIADVTSDGGYSKFAGYDRTQVLLDGRGITLCHDGVRHDHLASPLAMARFSGDADTVATLHDGPIRAFNVMTRRDTCSSTVRAGRRADGLAPESGGTAMLVYAVGSDVQMHRSGDPPNTASGPKAIPVTTGHLLVLRDPDAAPVLAGGAAIAISIHPLASRPAPALEAQHSRR